MTEMKQKQDAFTHGTNCTEQRHLSSPKHRPMVQPSFSLVHRQMLLSTLTALLLKLFSSWSQSNQLSLIHINWNELTSYSVLWKNTNIKDKAGTKQHPEHYRGRFPFCKYSRLEEAWWSCTLWLMDAPTCMEKNEERRWRQRVTYGTQCLWKSQS